MGKRKFKPGDKVFVESEGKFVEGMVVEYWKDTPDDNIPYCVEYNNKIMWFSTKEMYSDKENVNKLLNEYYSR